jgi:hypothetical protein
VQDYCQELDFSRLPELRELHFMLSVPDPALERWYPAPRSISQLKFLEVLQLGRPQTRYPFQGPFLDFDCSDDDVTPFELLASCTNLKTLGHASLPDVSFEVCLPHLLSLQLVAGKKLPEILKASCFPSLQHLVVECCLVTPSIVQRLAQLTALTCLQLNTGEVFYRSLKIPDQQEGSYSWCGLEPLGHSLHLLCRLELVSCYGYQERDFKEMPLVMPNLSSFSQLKQLQLACALNPEDIIPDQPSPADFLAGLSELTQLEQLEVLGYSSVTPGLLTDLVSCLPGLRFLEVGLCRHPSLVQAGAASDVNDGDVELLPVHRGFAQASRACERLRPGLRVQVGYTPQWLP